MMKQLVLTALTACSSSAPEPPPAKPSTGAPFAFVVDAVKPAGGMLDLRGFNFSDKPIDTYSIVIHYKDAGGGLLKVQPGTPFEQDYGHWSMAGAKYACAPRTWCAFHLKHVEVPEKAATAQVLASSLRVTGDNSPMFESPTFGWPASEK